MTADTLAIVLAAGEGTRMKSATPKVLHPVAGLSLLGHTLASVKAAGLKQAAVVIGPDRPDVAREAEKRLPGAPVFVQAERRGTAHAVLQARSEVARGYRAVVVLFADTPLVRPETIRKLAQIAAETGAISAMGFHAKDPTGYGRFLMQGDAIAAIREHKDATEAERAITLCNGGLMGLPGARALELLDAIGSNNAQNEFYLTDAVAVGRARGIAAAPVIVEEEEAFGVNDRAQLAFAEGVLQTRLRRAAMLAGATMTDPSSVYLSMDTKLARDVTIEPGVFFGPGVEIEEGAVIHAWSHLEGARVGRGVSVGPFARLRPGADLGEKAKVGNFVEVKAAQVGPGAKISHLSYIGDAKVGAEANIGAGTITCNYDGFRKHITDIGANAFIGSNSALVAPVRIGQGAFVGSGSVITEDVADNALALGRGRQYAKAGWADEFRARPENVAKKKG